VCAIVVQFRDLERAEARALLAELHVGSIAFAFHDRVHIALVNYVYRDDWIYGRMEDGPDLETLRHHQWVALEAHEATGIYDWQTVTVNGSIELLSTPDSHASGRESREAVTVLRSVVPEILTEHDPAPQRVQLFRLHVDSVDGREVHAHPHRSLMDARAAPVDPRYR
jgi:nitroimidazol reductase NimA-like FMN-containing flavoprotein (pyridoxamine 5'-phosphate oxidase superfamily)